MIPDGVIKFPLRLPLASGASVDPNGPLRFYSLIFHVIGETTRFNHRTWVYRCMDCAAAGLVWDGMVTETDMTELQDHAKTHSEMAQWYEYQILPWREDER
jgi:hypothetical protein